MSLDRPPTFAATVRSFAQDPGLPFADTLPEALIEDFGQQEGVHFGSDDGAVSTPAVTLWAFLGHCLSGSTSCVAAVARVLVLRGALDLPPCAAATGASCLARAKLPEAFLRRLALHVGTAVERQTPDAWRWRGRRTLLADGAECALPDTPANPAAYPQPAGQKQGVGFPMIRLVVLLTFATACRIGCALGPPQGTETGEPALVRARLDLLQAGDVVVADRSDCSSWLVALRRERGVDGACRRHQRRQYDFRRGQRRGRGDHGVRWATPARPAWLDADTDARVPDTLTGRAVRVVVDHPGDRSREIVGATTLLDAQSYRTQDIADRYHRRWHVARDIRAIKHTLRMDILSCQTPARVRQEVWAHLLADNLVRPVMAQAALAAGRQPRQLSFAGAVPTLNAVRWRRLLGGGGDAQHRLGLARGLGTAVGTHQVGNRPGGVEPRKVKRRPKGDPRLTKPRAQERADLLRGAQG